MFKKWSNDKKGKRDLVEKTKGRERSISLPIICDIESEPNGVRDTLKQFRGFVKDGVGVDTARVNVTKTTNGRRHSFTYNVDEDIIMTFHLMESD